MRLLIDGYNLMYAAGLLGRPFSPTGFRKVRQRFLNELAALLDPVDVQQTTIVFDASSPPDGLPRETNHKGLTVEFAADDESADARIEWLIAHHSNPKTLTVVSSDRRIRQAAHRRRSQELTSEAFLEQLDLLKEGRPTRAKPAPTPEDIARKHGLTPDQAAYWEAEFRDLADDPQLRAQIHDNSRLLTDEEMAQIEREVEGER
jgi:predicted RNA-binding protein with PIN domain